MEGSRHSKKSTGSEWRRIGRPAASRGRSHPGASSDVPAPRGQPTWFLAVARQEWALSRASQLLVTSVRLERSKLSEAAGCAVYEGPNNYCHASGRGTTREVRM